jgi:hypothetical protein
LFKHTLILFTLFFSYSLILICLIFCTSYLKITHETYPFGLKNFFVISNSRISNNIESFFASAQTAIGGSDGGSKLLPPVNDSNTFYTKGVLSSVLFPNYDFLVHGINASSSSFSSSDSKNENIVNTSLYEFPKLISGIWSLNVTQGDVTNFYSTFKLVTSDGLEKHFVNLTNFQTKNASIILNPYTNTIINGYVDIKIDDQLFESHSPIKIELNRINTIIVYIDNQNVNNLLFNNPIYGIVNSFKNFKNDELLILDNQ